MIIDKALDRDGNCPKKVQQCTLMREVACKFVNTIYSSLEPCLIILVNSM